MAKAERERQRKEKARVRNIEKQRRERERQQKLARKEAKEYYIQSRFNEVDRMNDNLVETLNELSGILDHTLNVDDTISFDGLKIKGEYKEFQLPKRLGKEIQKPNLLNYKSPDFFDKLFPGWEKRWETRVEAAEARYKKGMEKYSNLVEEREKEIDQLQQKYDEGKKAFQEKLNQRNFEVNEFEKSYFAGDSNAIVSYCSMVLERSEYPEVFPQEFRIAYVPEPNELVIEYELPTSEVAPMVEQYSYIKTKDEIREKAKAKTKLKHLYQDVVASVCLRTIHEMFEADQGNHVGVIVFNGFVQTIDPATGQDIRPYILSVRTTKERFEEINLSRVDKLVCLRNLGASVSSSPQEASPVKPIVEFSMVDPRFVNQSDVLSDLEARPNLMDLDPFEFENLISNLFSQMGFETKQTRTSKDGGVDAIAFDTRPIVGGKLVIQAKRYKNVVGVSAARDLYGTMINEGANKGILVTTSHYGAAAYDFVNDKPIELIDGGGLLYLLDQINVSARIVFPSE